MNGNASQRQGRTDHPAVVTDCSVWQQLVPVKHPAEHHSLCCKTRRTGFSSGTTLSAVLAMQIRLHSHEIVMPPMNRQ